MSVRVVWDESRKKPRRAIRERFERYVEQGVSKYDTVCELTAITIYLRHRFGAYGAYVLLQDAADAAITPKLPVD